MEPFISYDMPASEYHAHEAMSQSTLKKIEKSPRHLRWYMENGEPDRPVFALGRATHTAILEPEKLDSTIAVFTGAVRRGKAWEEFQALNDGKDIVTQAEYNLMLAMSDSFHTKTLTRNMCAGAKVESSIFWSDTVTDISCKARLDIKFPDIVYDLKTAEDASFDGFQRAAVRYGYHRQAAWYLDAASSVSGQRIEKYGFVVIEKSPPFEVQVFFCDSEFIELGRQENARDLALYAHCLRTGEWPGYPNTIQTLTLRD